MAEYGEWNRKGATLSDVTAKKEYGVDRDFITKGIHAGKLEYREGVAPLMADKMSGRGASLSSISPRSLATIDCREARIIQNCARSRRK